MKLDLEKLGACYGALEYFNSKPDFETAWNECPRGDWMLCVAGKLYVDKELIARTAVECAWTVRYLMRDPRSINALDKAIEFLDGKISREEIKIASEVARDVASVAVWAAEAHNATEAAAAAVATAAGTAAEAAAYAEAAADTAADTAYQKNQRKTADICRKYFTPAILVAVKKYEIIY